MRDFSADPAFVKTDSMQKLFFLYIMLMLSWWEASVNISNMYMSKMQSCLSFRNLHTVLSSMSCVNASMFCSFFTLSAPHPSPPPPVFFPLWSLVSPKVIKTFESEWSNQLLAKFVALLGKIPLPIACLVILVCQSVTVSICPLCCT